MGSVAGRLKMPGAPCAGVLLALAVAAGCAGAAGAATKPATCNYAKYGRQDPAFVVRNLEVTGPIKLAWAPKNLAHGEPAKATPALACKVAAALADATVTFWGEQGANVPKLEAPEGVGPKGTYWTSTGWNSRMTGSVGNRQVHWTFRESGAGSVGFDVSCSHRGCKAT